MKGEQKEVDATQERDTRVVSFVSFFLKAIGSFPFAFDKGVEKENQSYYDFYENKFMPGAFERNLQCNDLNYTFSLATRAVEMLQARSTSTQVGNELRVYPAAAEILNILGEADTLLLIPTLDTNGNEKEKDGEARAELYDSFYNDIVVPVFKKHGVEYNEMQQVFAIMKAMVDSVKEKTELTLNTARDTTDAKLYGVDDIDNLTLQRLHEKATADSV